MFVLNRNLKPGYYFDTRKILLIVFFVFTALSAYSQRYLQSGYKVEVRPCNEVFIYFDKEIREWDGFGVNYVEACQTRDYRLFSQDYSGFSFATPETREAILDLIFGKEGLKPALTKLFLDPFHEGMSEKDNDNDDPLDLSLKGFDHTTSTKWMLWFNKEGIRRMKSWNGTLSAITTLYSPAPWMTKQKYILGRDHDPAEKEEIAEYIVSWAKYLREKENIPVRYVSLHNEGDAYYRWPRDGSNPGEDHRDYNMYWSPELVSEMMILTRKTLDINNLSNIAVTPGETQNWYRFDLWGYAGEILDNKEALNSIGLITSHSFANTEDPNSIYYGDFRSTGQDILQSVRPELKVWVTSRPWSEGVQFIENIRRDIYESKANGVIPWALISGEKQWLLSNGTYSDGSMNAAFLIKEDGSFKINPQYYFYKQVTRAGQAGMKVCRVVCLDPSLGVIAFSSNGTSNPDSFIIINRSDKPKDVTITISAGQYTDFQLVRSSDSEKYEMRGTCERDNKGRITYTAPEGSVTTFLGIN